MRDREPGPDRSGPAPAYRAPSGRGFRTGRRDTRPGLDIGICGEHGGDPKSIAFCHRLGLDYVSCSPFRVPVARLAAAHAALRQRKARPVRK